MSEGGFRQIVGPGGVRMYIKTVSESKDVDGDGKIGHNEFGVHQEVFSEQAAENIATQYGYDLPGGKEEKEESKTLEEELGEFCDLYYSDYVYGDEEYYPEEEEEVASIFGPEKNSWEDYVWSTNDNYDSSMTCGRDYQAPAEEDPYQYGTEGYGEWGGEAHRGRTYSEEDGPNPAMAESAAVTAEGPEDTSQDWIHAYDQDLYEESPSPTAAAEAPAEESQIGNSAFAGEFSTRYGDDGIPDAYDPDQSVGEVSTISSSRFAAAANDGASEFAQGYGGYGPAEEEPPRSSFLVGNGAPIAAEAPAAADAGVSMIGNAATAVAAKVKPIKFGL